MGLSLVSSLAACALLALSPSPPATTTPGVFPADSAPYGLGYADWSASWWQWFLEHPVAGHPSIDDPSFDVTSGQTGKVWFLAAPTDFGPAVPRTRNITIPKGKSLFVAMLNSEASSLEDPPFHGDTAEEQLAAAQFFSDHIVVADLTCSLDGNEVENLGDYRFASPQFSFTAPDPWIFGPTGAGGTGTSVGDGYYVFLKPLSVGQHVLHYSGHFHFEAGELGPDAFDLSLDMTYVIDVTPF